MGWRSAARYGKEAALKDTVVLIFSILAAQSRAREAGADAFLMKPLAEQRLVQTVRELLAQAQRARQSWRGARDDTERQRHELFPRISTGNPQADVVSRRRASRATPSTS